MPISRALEREADCAPRAQSHFVGSYQHDIESEFVGLDGHIVVRAKVAQNGWIALDPDYNAMIPYDI